MTWGPCRPQGSGGGFSVLPSHLAPQIREQNRQEVKSAGPQSQVLASVIAESSRSPVRPPCTPNPATQHPNPQGGDTTPGGLFQSTESHLGDAEAKEALRQEGPPEPEPPNPFSQLTDQELEEYKREVERKKLGLQGRRGMGGPHHKFHTWGCPTDPRASVCLCLQVTRRLRQRRPRLRPPNRPQPPRRPRSTRRVSVSPPGTKRRGCGAKPTETQKNYTPHVPLPPGGSPCQWGFTPRWHRSHRLA